MVHEFGLSPDSGNRVKIVLNQNRTESEGRFNQGHLERLLDVKMFLLDLDGTVYLEDELIPGVSDFIKSLTRRKIPFVFLTNNSSHNTKEYVERLNSFGFPVQPENVLTSGLVTGSFISQKKPGAALYVVGTDSLKEELASFNLKIHSHNSAGVDFVVAGFDTQLTYEKILAACMYLDSGAGFVATNPDLVCPVKHGRFVPDCGSICVMLKNATGREPIFMGKPHTFMVQHLRSRFGLPPSSMAIIGDRLTTDIALGFNGGLTTICVLSGEATVEDIRKSPLKPDFVVHSIDQLNEIF